MTILRKFRNRALLLTPACTLACGGAAAPLSPSGNSDGGVEAEVAADGGNPTQGDAGATPGNDAASEAAADAMITGEAGSDAGAAAVTGTIATNALCTAIPSFYWEIGDASGPLLSGSVGTGFGATTKMNIASASKMVFGAYVIERFKADLTKMDPSLMRMLGGYTGFVYDTCLGSTTVSACEGAAKNATVTPADVGVFYYSGGDFQSYAAGALGLGGDTNAQLATDIKSLVGTELAFTYTSPQLAGGINTSASDYAAFLRKVLAGNLALHDHLGESPVCTLPGTVVPGGVQPGVSQRLALLVRPLGRGRSRERRRRLQQRGRIRLLSVDRRHEDLLRHRRQILARQRRVPPVGAVRRRDPQGLRDRHRAVVPGPRARGPEHPHR